MIRGTTPDYILLIDGVDISGTTVYVTIKQDDYELTLTNDDVGIGVDESGSAISISLSQENTLGLRVGKASVQVRLIDDTGRAFATTIGTINVTRVLLEGVITYG